MYSKSFFGQSERFPALHDAQFDQHFLVAGENENEER
jgi:hypothetical protein